MGVRGITKVRDEAHIISASLDNWAKYCTDGIHVYDDGSTDGTPDICHEHPAVNEVISSDLFDPDRERAEWYCRHTVLHSARRFMSDGDWLCVFDADEHLEEFDATVLQDPQPSIVACMLFEAYITQEDRLAKSWNYRDYVAPEYQVMPYFYRWWENSGNFTEPDQRILRFGSPMLLSGKARHYGKAISVEHFDRKCDYYSTHWPKYAEKWAARKGKAVHEVSDFGNPLVRWEHILDGTVQPMDTFMERKGEAVT